jgi:hypothetical protein
MNLGGLAGVLQVALEEPMVHGCRRYRFRLADLQAPRWRLEAVDQITLRGQERDI